MITDRHENQAPSDQTPTASGWLRLPRPWIFLAPMSGLADWPYREICYEFGAEVTVSPLISAPGLGASPRHLMRLIGGAHGSRPFVVQLYGRRPEDFRRAARLLTDELPLAGIDINMGCPANKVVNSLHGSALLREPERAAAIVAATRAGTHLPVSVKLRSGWDNSTAPELSRQLEAAGASALIIHGRTREQQYRGSNSLSAIAETKRAVGIPVIGNGDITSVHRAQHMLEATGVDGIMVGRGAVGNPWLFAQLQAALKGNEAYSQKREAAAETMR
ncbi:MAG: tRNA dihydrouridine synthase, partial [Chloroflexota bacterium]